MHEIYRFDNFDKDMLLISPVSRNQDTLLITACRTGNTAIVRTLLLCCGEYIREISDDSDHDTDEEDLLKPRAVIDGYTNKARLARMINTVNCEGETALTLACQKGYVAIVELLLGALFDTDKRKALDQSDRDGNSVIMCAVNWGNDETVKVILAACSASDRLSIIKKKDNIGRFHPQ